MIFDLAYVSDPKFVRAVPPDFFSLSRILSHGMYVREKLLYRHVTYVLAADGAR